MTSMPINERRLIKHVRSWIFDKTVIRFDLEQKLFDINLQKFA